MINFLDDILRRLFVSRLPDDITDEAQVSFELPDEDFRSQTKTHGRNVINVCLVELRENRTGAAGGAGGDLPPARRVDCHYLISAWSPAAKGAEPTLDEHALLYRALSVLTDAEPLDARDIFAAAPLPAGFPDALRDAPLPTVVLPIERFSRVAEFWAASKGVPWKPTIHLVVTLPLVPIVRR